MKDLSTYLKVAKLIPRYFFYEFGCCCFNAFKCKRRTESKRNSCCMGKFTGLLCWLIKTNHCISLPLSFRCIFSHFRGLYKTLLETRNLVLNVIAMCLKLASVEKSRICKIALLVSKS